jgi:hypothetical protein
MTPDKKDELKFTIETLFTNTNIELEREFFSSEFSPEHSTWDDDEQTIFKNALLKNKIEVNHVDNYGGEGEGEEFWSVYSFTKGETTIYVKFDGSYYSYDGSTYDEWSFVEAKEKMITVYE